MHAEGWIFDVEMLMLAESAPAVTAVKGALEPRGIRVAEMPIGWHEIEGSKMNVLWDSFGMAWGLAMLRACWMLGVYRRR
jgi:dolichyl-phosphate beta-glucosyltransferase